MRRSERWLVPMLLAAAGCGSARLKAPNCPSGQHDGGKGKCVADGACVGGYYDDGSGTCRAPAATDPRTTMFLRAVGRPIDLVFSVDNAGMGPEVTKMNAQLTRLIGALKHPTDGSLPDLRIAVIDSDLGTGCRWGYGGCGPTAPPDNGCFGDQGIFQMRTSPTACQFTEGAQFLEIENNQPVNFTGPVDNVTDVLACLTSNLGAAGCGYQHQLQAFEFALAAKGIGTEEQQERFLRPSAVLGLIFISEEDDCSAATNYGMFQPSLPGESASLRCATRAHACGGQNLSDSGPGYPTTATFRHPLSDCQARIDACPNPTDGSGETDTSVPTACSPLKSVKHLADEIKALKADPERQIVVAGIFGWPRADEDPAVAEYRIGLVPNANVADTEHPTLYASFPACYHPDHLPTRPDANGYDAEAFGYGAMPGLRNAAFVDEFGANGQKHSICERDFTAAMTAIGSRLALLAGGACIDVALADTDLATPGLQPDCQVFSRFAQPNPADPNETVYLDSQVALPFCAGGASNGAVAADCWRVVDGVASCAPTGLRLEIVRADPQAPSAADARVQCRR